MVGVRTGVNRDANPPRASIHRTPMVTIKQAPLDANICYRELLMLNTKANILDSFHKRSRDNFTLFQVFEAVFQRLIS